MSVAYRTLLNVTGPAPFTVQGGTVTTSGIYTLHTFTGSGTLTVTGVGDVDYLIIGGGSGCRGFFDSNDPGGGGAGGDLKEIFNYNISAGTYTVTVGAGGASFSNAIGGESSISTIDSALGAPSNSNTINELLGKNSRNKSGGINFGTGRAGGGASHNQDGGDATSTKGGNGGLGTLSTILGVKYCGGGGGGGTFGLWPGGDGVDGGGSGGGLGIPDGASGMANTGGGGGGKSSSSQRQGGNGGSGRIVIRYITP